MSDDDQQLVDEISTSTERNNEVDEMDEWVVDIEGRVVDPNISHGPRQPMDGDSSDSEEEEEPSIFGKWECWDDFGASFIPERKKWQLVACMTQWFGLNVKSYLKYMQRKVDLAWSYYHEVDEQFRAKNSKNFIEHLLASSCFLIFAMFFLQDHEEYEKVIVDKMDDPNSFPKGLTRKDYGNLLTIFKDHPVENQCYMLTMKYQIPWFVLEAVYTKLSNIGKVLDIPIHKFALPCFPKIVKVHPSKVDGVTVPEHGFKHLLHIFHWSRSPDKNFLGYSTKKVYRFHIPSAIDLILSQTVFVKDEGGSIDVSYSNNRRLSGSVIQLTPFRLRKYTTKLYEDLLIFERECSHCHRHYGMPFTIYFPCMTCLVKTEADARVLRENGVIPSTTFDDKEVLRCVQELKTFIADDVMMTYELANLEEEVMAHYQKSAYKVYGEFKKRYCSNPWIIISVIAGILLFLLTFLQTLYGMLSYYNQ